MIAVGNTGTADSPQIAMDEGGNAIAVWKQYDGSDFHIWASYFDGRAWGAAEFIETEDNTENSDSPQIAINNDGDAIAVWSQHDGFRYNIWANNFDGSAWDTAEMIESDNSGSATLPQIAMDDSGNAIAVWEQRDGNRNISANYFNGTAWGTARLIESVDTGNAYYPQIAMNGEGNAIAVWSQYDGFNYNIWANNFEDTAWGTAEIIDTTNIGSAYSPQIAMDPVGDAVTVWEQDDSFRYNIWANFLDADVEEGEVAEWGIGIPIEAEKTNDAVSPQLAMDDEGNAIAVWRQFNGSKFSIYANRFE